MSDKKKKGKDAAAEAAAENPEAAPPEVPTPSPTPGAFKVLPADDSGRALHDNGKVDPSKHEAVDLYFAVLSATEAPPKEQMDLLDAIGQVLTTVQKLYVSENGEQKAPFRLFYTRLFRLAQIGLEGNALPDVAQVRLDRVVDDLIRAEGPRAKNGHLKKLAKSAGGLMALFALFYSIISFAPIDGMLSKLNVEAGVAKGFMMLWVGTFAGVWLSYAIRKADFTLHDLTMTESDFLEPTTRLVFAGLLSTVIGLLLLLGAFEVKVGSLSLASFSKAPTVALLMGMVFGINEIMLPTSVAKRAKELFDKI